MALTLGQSRHKKNQSKNKYLSVLGMNTVIFGLKMTSLKKERDSLVQKLQQEGPTDVQRTRTLQRENAQVCSFNLLKKATY